MMRVMRFTAALAAILSVGGEAWAGTGGYFVTYNSGIEKGEIELMFMTDITAPSRFRREDDGFGTYMSHMVELEYSPFHQFATEFMIEWFEDFETSDAKFTGFRWESRYRIFKKEVPLNPMVYVEYEDLDPGTRYKMEVSGWIDPPYAETGGEPDRERILETRLVLSQDFGPVNVAFNWINETDLENGETAFGYALGAMWMLHHHEEHEEAGSTVSKSEKGPYSCSMHPKVKSDKPGKCPKCGMTLAPNSTSDKSEEKEEHGKGVGLGLELYGALGDTKSFGLIPSRQEHYVGPIFMYHLNDHWMFHTQLAVGLSKASDNLFRMNVGYEF
ncbi:MAG: hypothetical protein HY541_06430 [Deltaproteobacteria bacterium]|nr:hypothetical protein [Deltaproteobacteria bacterium]